SSTRLLMVPVSPCTTTSIEMPCHVMAPMASTMKIIHIGMPRNRSAKAPIAMVVSTLLWPLGGVLCGGSPGVAPGDDGVEVAGVGHRHQREAQRDRQRL